MIRNAFAGMLLVLVICGQASASHMPEASGVAAPPVMYSAPRSEAEIDVSQNDTILFKWKPQPTPAGGRLHYAFTIFKGHSGKKIYDEKLPAGQTSIEVPSELFEEGVYTWQVRQRSIKYRSYSRKERWKFTIINGED